MIIQSTKKPKSDTKTSTTTKKKPTSKKQLVAQFSLPANMGFQEKLDKILQNPENYQIKNSPFTLHTKSSIISQALMLGLQYMLDHPKAMPTDAETNLFAQAVGKQLFPLIDARLKDVFESSLENYLNTKSTNLYCKNILLALSKKLGEDITDVSINKLLGNINRNIDYIIEEEKRKLKK